MVKRRIRSCCCSTFCTATQRHRWSVRPYYSFASGHENLFRRRYLNHLYCGCSSPTVTPESGLPAKVKCSSLINPFSCNANFSGKQLCYIAGKQLRRGSSRILHGATPRHPYPDPRTTGTTGCSRSARRTTISNKASRKPATTKPAEFTQAQSKAARCPHTAHRTPGSAT
jgi:hypothetical protein